jgi:RHS repeat-associated protein
MVTTFDSYSNVTDIKRYDFGGTAPITEDLISYGSWNGSSCVAIGSNINNRVCRHQVKDGAGNLFGDSRFSYDSHGNQTSFSKWTGSSYLFGSAMYNTNGTVSTSTDINGTVTTYAYNGTGGCNNGLLTSSTMGGLTYSLTWDCNGGVVTSTTDANGQPTTVGFVGDGADPFWRPETATDEFGNVTTFDYTPTTVESAMTFNGGASISESLTTVDGLGRKIDSQTRIGPSASNYNTGSYGYDSSGRLSKTSVPCQTTRGALCSFTNATTQTYDALGRPLVTTDSGSGTITNSYSNGDVLTTLGPAPTNENVKKRQYEYDGLGRLISVCEITTASGSGPCRQRTAATGFLTSYAYSVPVAGGSQLVVTQGVQTRTFTYDGLGRMLTETNPETGTTRYAYDTSSCAAPHSAGDLSKKTDAVGNIFCYYYDPLHRVTSITYSGPNAANTPTKTFVYDSATVNGVTMSNAKGRLAEAYTGTSSSKITDLGFSYDALGRTIKYLESTPHSGGYYNVSASYYANNALNTLSGVSLPTLTYNLDGMGRVSSVNANSGTNPASGITYNHASQVTGVTYGSNDAVSFTYDPNTGRMTEYRLTINGTATYGDLTWNPNGSLQQLDIKDPFNAADVQTCTYSADDLARISSVSCVNGSTNVWNQNFAYDAFGNITKTVPINGTGISWNPGYDPATNHYTLAGSSYDANGNLLNDLFHSYAWSVDGNPTTLDGLTLIYDALGREVEMQNGTTNTEFVFGPTGKLALMNGQTQTKAFVAFPGGTQVKYAGSSISTYRLPDWLGSFRVGSTNSRTHSWGIAFAPFGEQYAQSGSPALSFTGEQGTADTVTDEYDFLARKLHPSQGRWISPDPAGLAAVDLANPQTWNRYAYVGNDPCGYIDALGLSQCSLSVGISFQDFISSAMQKNIESTLQGLFGPDIALQFVVGGVGDVNVNVAAFTSFPGANGATGVGEVPTVNGQPLNSGIVDFGLLLSYQYYLGGLQGQTNRLGSAIGRVGAHELGHELLLGHNNLGGIMAIPNNPFSPLQFSSAEHINLLSRCQYLKNHPAGGIGGGGGDNWIAEPVFGSILVENPDGPGYVVVYTGVIGYEWDYVGGQRK